MVASVIPPVRRVAAAVRHGAAAMLLVPLLTPAVRSQEPPTPPEPGDRVRIQWVDTAGVRHTAEGNLMALSAEQVSVEGPLLEVTVVDTDRLEALEVRRGGTAVAGVIGFAIGFGFGSKIAEAAGHDGPGEAFLGAVLGGVLGAVVLSSVVDGAGWTETPIPGRGPGGTATPLIGFERIESSAAPAFRLGLRVPVGR